jgi:hypothetical protein
VSGVQQALIRSLGAEEVPPPPILGMVLTSGLYPVVVEGDVVDLGCTIGGQISLVIFFETESVDLAAAAASITMVATITYNNYTNWPFEAVDMAAGAAPITLVATISYVNYVNWPFEAVDLAAAPPAGNSITLVQTINFINNAMLPESVDLVANPGSITLV